MNVSTAVYEEPAQQGGQLSRYVQETATQACKVQA